MAELVKAIGDAFIRAIEFDNHIASDKKKYSNWIFGLATAGFALALTQADKILTLNSAAPAVGNIVLKSSATVFIVSAVVGAIVVKSVDRQVDFNRQSMTLILRQELLLSFAARPWTPGDEPPEIVIRKITAGEYLNTDSKKIYSEMRSKSKSAGTWAERLLIFQQVLVAVGYAAIFGVAVL